MSVNSSSSSNNVCLLDIEPYPTNSSFFMNMRCFISRPSSLVFAFYSITAILLLLPLCSFIFYLGLQRWRQQRSSTTATISHFNSFTYHMVAMELVGVFGYTMSLYGTYTPNVAAMKLGFFFICFTWTGQISFHALTCLERYLAVVHPVTYLSLRTERGIRIRNVTSGCVWLLCITHSCLYILEVTTLDFYLSSVFFVVFIFCSLSVLCALTRRGPGGQDRDRGRVDQSKLRAFYTIMVILGVLSLRALWNLVWLVVSELKLNCECLITMIEFWFTLPSSLLLPLLYLHRSGKLGCCKKKIETEQQVGFA